MLPRRLLLLVAFAFLASLAPAHACNIPVFRYALERWRAERDEDLYRVLIFHRGPLTRDQEAAREFLRKQSDDAGRRANLVTELVDVSGPMPAAVRVIWQTQKEPLLPWVVLRYADDDVKRPSPWVGPLNLETVKRLADSPARREIARRILRGDSVVWVLLESGDKTADDAAAKLLQAELPKLEKVVELPEGAGEGPVKLLSELPLRIAFTMVRIRRDDPAEQAFIGMLLHSEDDLPGEKQPMAFPFFGRGRALEARVGKGINPDELLAVSRFLCGACSCQVKRLNPGFDVLMTAGWDSVLSGLVEKEPERPGVEGQMVPIASGNSSLPPPVGAMAPDELQRSLDRMIWGQIIIGITALALTVFVILRLLRASRDKGTP